MCVERNLLRRLEGQENKQRIRIIRYVKADLPSGSGNNGNRMRFFIIQNLEGVLEAGLSGLRRAGLVLQIPLRDARRHGLQVPKEAEAAAEPKRGCLDDGTGTEANSK